MADEKDTKKTSHAELLELARKRFIVAQEAEAKIRKEALDDLKFRVGQQWPDEIRRQRELQARPCLTINQMPQFIRQVTNEQRQNRPAIQIDPTGDGADQDTADVFSGIIRHIEYDSDADVAYDTAFQAAVTSSFGYFRINTAYEDPTSFDQVIKILRVRNAFTVYMDPGAKEADRSDAGWAFIVETMNKDEFKAQYPDAEASAMTDWSSIGDVGDWFEKDQCRVAEYFYRESIAETLCLLSDGSTVVKSVLPKVLPEGVKVLKERPTQLFAVKWVKMTGTEVLEETDWLGRWIPIIPVLGDELDVDGELVLEGIVRNAKDPQKQYNFMASATTETIALAPKAPFVGAEGQFEGHEEAWKRANTANMPYLEFKPVSFGGEVVGRPERQTFEPAIQATTMAMMQANQDLHSTTGIYEAALGARGNETSGRGIEARQQQSQGSNYHYADNLARALKHTGRILLDLIPKVYDTQRVIRIIAEDGKASTATIGPAQTGADGQPLDPAMVAKVDRIYDLGAGRYDVRVSTGPSYQTRRQAAQDGILGLVKAFPQIMPVAGDKLVRVMDFPGSSDIADRMEKMLPPQLQENEGQNQLPPQAQQALAQLTQQNQQLTQHLNAATEEIKQRNQKVAMELESKERVAFEGYTIDRLKIQLEIEKLRVSMVNAALEAKDAAAQAEMDRENDTLQQLSSQAHEYAMQQANQDHQQEMAQQQQGADAQAQESQQQFQGQQAQQAQQAAAAQQQDPQQQ